ncbi:4-hydroxy-tetrahydrodipicolinate synthase [soil metagenome]
MPHKFTGTGIALVTPFNEDGSIDFDSLKKLIEHDIKGGVEYLVSLGTTGETATLNKDEKLQVLRFTAEVVNGRVPLVAGFGANDTRELLENINGFDFKGYDALLSASPYYSKPTQEGIYRHYMAVADVSPVPVILYNVPARTSSNVTAETTLRLARDHKNIMAIKEASGNFDQVMQIIKNRPEGFLVISGDDLITLPLIGCGADGVISVIGNAMPAEFSEMVRLALKSDFEAARKLHYKLTDLTNLLFVEGNPGGVKATLQHLGIAGDQVRLPLWRISDGLKTKLKQELETISRG